MATMTSTVPLVLATIRDRMAARRDADPDGPLKGVVFTATPSGDPIPHESLQLFGTDGDQAWGAIGNRRREETYTIGGGILIVVRGAGEAIADAARERAYAILAELEDELRRFPNLELIAGQIQAQLSRVNLDQGPQDNGRWAALDIGIAVKASLASS